MFNLYQISHIKFKTFITKIYISYQVLHKQQEAQLLLSNAEIFLQFIIRLKSFRFPYPFTYLTTCEIPTLSYTWQIYCTCFNFMSLLFHFFSPLHLGDHSTIFCIVSTENYPFRAEPSHKHSLEFMEGWWLSL